MLGVIEFIGSFLHYLALGREIFYKWFLLHIIHKWCYLFGIHLLDYFKHFGFGRYDFAFLFGQNHHHHHVTIFIYQCLESLSHCLYRYLLSHHIHHLIFSLDARHWFVVEEVFHTFVNVLRRFHLIAVVIALLK